MIPPGRRRWRRAPIAFVGAVGAVGLAVVYFLDPLEGPRRRREVVEWVQGTSREAWRLSHELVARVLVPAETPVSAQGAGASEEQETADLDTALRDEVTFVTMKAPVAPEPRFHSIDAEPEVALVPVVVAAPIAERYEEAAEPATAVSYLTDHTPRPTIIAYDRPDDELAADEPVVADADQEDAPRRGRFGRGWLAAAAAVTLAVAAAALGAWALVAAEDDQVAAPAIPSGAAEAIELISEGARSLPVQGSQGTMVLVAAPDGRAALVISGLEAAPPGKEYQAWVVTGKSPTSAGLFKGGVTRLVVPLSVRVPQGAIVAVTVEVAGGAPAPTQQPRYTVQRA